MDITRNVLGNTELMRVVEEARASRSAKVKGSPSRSVRSKRFPPIVTHMISIGERSGQLEEMLEHVAAAYDQQVDVRVQAMTSLLEPLIIVIMGGMSGGDRVLDPHASPPNQRVRRVIDGTEEPAPPTSPCPGNAEATQLRQLFRGSRLRGRLLVLALLVLGLRRAGVPGRGDTRAARERRHARGDSRKFSVRHRALSCAGGALPAQRPPSWCIHRARAHAICALPAEGRLGTHALGSMPRARRSRTRADVISAGPSGSFFVDDNIQ